MTSYRIGVDVGGTYTDAVLLQVDEDDKRPSSQRGIIATVKQPTTAAISDGIEAAVVSLLTRTTHIDLAKISGLMIGTTHFTNAVIEADSRRLSRVAVLRLGSPYTESCPPFVDFPAHLRSVIDGHVAILRGGLQIDGKMINDIDESEIIRESRKIKEKGLKAVAIVGVFASLDKADGTSQEERVKDILIKSLGPELDIVCSRDVGHLGLIERENATILNASIMSFARTTIRGFQAAMRKLKLGCPLFLTQNDGTLTSAENAARLPVRTFSAAVTNSMRGAAYLSGLSTQDMKEKHSGNIIVVDIGGTTTDVGVLLPSGFPRQAAAYVTIGGVRTNLTMPDVTSIGLGGGSIIQQTPHGITVGPGSTGYNLLTEGLIFGGSTVTATDIAVSENSSLKIGVRDKLDRSVLTDEIIRGAKEAIKRHLESVIDKMKTSPEPATVILVGGGSILAPAALIGVKEIILPQSFACANAVGACVADISGEIDTVKILQDKTLEEALEECKALASKRAVIAGAKEDTVKIAEVEILPVQYVTNKATRIIVKAVGKLDVKFNFPSQSSVEVEMEQLQIPEENVPYNVARSSHSLNHPPTQVVDVTQYKPLINEKGEWFLSETDLEWISEGCAVLGTGGGGSPYPALLRAREIIHSGGSIRVISVDNLPRDAKVFRGCYLGAPSVSNERLPGLTEIQTACNLLAKFVNITAPDAIISDEIGGINGVEPLVFASSKHLNVPVVDGDLMGRAYPNVWQLLPAVYDVPNCMTPCALADGLQNTVILPSSSSQDIVETILRNICISLGSCAGLCMAPLSIDTCQKYSVLGTVSQAWRIGRAIAQKRQENDLVNIPAAIIKLQGGKYLFRGKIVNIEREVRAGFTWGTITIAPLSRLETEHADPVSDSSSHLIITFQNENILAELQNSKVQSRQCLAVAPDLVVVLDSQSGSSLGTHEYRYGLRVTVIALSASPLWTTEKALSKGGPTAFGLDIPFSSSGQYLEPRSVISEYMPVTH